MLNNDPSKPGAFQPSSAGPGSVGGVNPPSAV